MKKSIIIVLCAAMTLSGCDTYTGQGAMTGATFGTILGSAIGGAAGGPRGRDIGTVIGMASGAAVGAGIGSAIDDAKQEQYDQYMSYRRARYGDYNYGYGNANSSGSAYVASQNADDESGFDPTHSGDDRIEFETADDDGQQSYEDGVYTDLSPDAGESYTLSVNELKTALPGYKTAINKGIVVRNVTFADGNGDGALSRRESGKVTFEVMNNSGVTIYDVNPIVVETTGNKHIHISPPVRVGSIAPGRGVRYTATVYADSRVKDGMIAIKVAVVQGDREITSQVKELRIAVKRK